MPDRSHIAVDSASSNRATDSANGESIRSHFGKGRQHLPAPETPLSHNDGEPYLAGAEISASTESNSSSCKRIAKTMVGPSKGAHSYTRPETSDLTFPACFLAGLPKNIHEYFPTENC
ncbi:MAG: hypothetical protein ACI8UO_003570 [Verrucomicrobiales bacterium]|jgi:hypothetical protein